MLQNRTNTFVIIRQLYHFCKFVVYAVYTCAVCKHRSQSEAKTWMRGRQHLFRICILVCLYFCVFHVCIFVFLKYFAFFNCVRYASSGANLRPKHEWELGAAEPFHICIFIIFLLLYFSYLYCVRYASSEANLRPKHEWEGGAAAPFHICIFIILVSFYICIFVLSSLKLCAVCKPI